MVLERRIGSGSAREYCRPDRGTDKETGHNCFGHKELSSGY